MQRLLLCILLSGLLLFSFSQQIPSAPVTRQLKNHGEARKLDSLGTIFYETGNYQKAKNYFEKAIRLTTDSSVVFYYKIKIASLLVKLDQFEEAKAIYNSIPPIYGYENEINYSLAIISLKQQHFIEAINGLRKLFYPSDRKSIELYYNFGLAYSGLNQTDSAEFYLQRAMAENLRWNGKKKNFQLGLILKYQADELAKQQLFKDATAQYQQALLQFLTDYKETDPYQNPMDFNGADSYINLFNTLVAKAGSFEAWYQQEKNSKLLEAALNAYRTAFNLGEYVEKTFDSDEARLFLGKIKYTAHSKPINVSLLLYDLTRKKIYLEEAYFFDQQNKKIELGKVMEKIEHGPRFEELIEAERIPTINQLQKKLDPNTAVLSYHLTENELLILLITQSRFEYSKSIINKAFFNSLQSFKESLHEVEGNKAFNGYITASRLYEKLIGPVSNKLIQIKRLIIIPDDELHYLPFETLRDPGQKWLIEHFSIQYQYSTALLNGPGYKEEKAGVLSFDKLNTPEITNMKLDSVQLVILRDVKTDSGKLSKGEGLMSLSRAFAYAGCPNIISSLWKAGDQTTAYLTQQLHLYLEKNYTKDKALQQAKLDLLADEKIDPKLKSPVYWSHLVLIGDYEPRQAHSRWWWIAFVFIAGAIIYKIIGKKKEPVN